MQVLSQVSQPVTSSAGNRIAQVQMSRTWTTNRTLEPWPADTRHGFVPDHQHAGFTDPNIGRACGELGTPRAHPSEAPSSSRPRGRRFGAAPRRQCADWPRRSNREVPAEDDNRSDRKIQPWIQKQSFREPPIKKHRQFRSIKSVKTVILYMDNFIIYL